MRFQFHSQYTSDARADATAAVRQLREAVAADAGLNALYRGMAIAEAKIDALGPDFARAARRMNSYAPPTLDELDEMQAALGEPGKASCPGCEGFRCSACDGQGVIFAEPEAA